MNQSRTRVQARDRAEASITREKLGDRDKHLDGEYGRSLLKHERSDVNELQG